MNPLRRWSIVGVAAGVVLLLDQLSKQWAVDRLKGQAPMDVVWTLRLNYAENTGMAFSKGSGGGRWIALVVIGIVVALVLLARNVRSTVGLVLIGVVIGGAFGNLWDRLFRAAGGGFLSGAVVDFIDVQWWPIFNIADASVVVGGILLALYLLREPVDGHPPEDTSAPGPQNNEHNGPEPDTDADV